MPADFPPTPDRPSASVPATAVDRVESGRDGTRRWWRVGADRVELLPRGPGWDARVRRAGWGGVPLDLDGYFPGEAEALAWCERMAGVLRRDVDEAEDDGRPA